MAELDDSVRMEGIRQLSDHIRPVGIGAVVQIADDLLRQRMERFCLVHLFHGIDDDIAGDDLVFPVGVKIALQRLLIERKQMDPQDLFAVKLRIVLDILYHKPDQIKKFLLADEQMHSHHHIEMADQLAGIIPFTLQFKEAHQFFSRLILNAYCIFQFLFVKGFSETSLKFCRELF